MRTLANQSLFLKAFTLSLSISFLPAVVWAEPTDSVTPAPAATDAPATPAAKTKKVYEGSVKSAALIAEEGLGRIGDATEQIQATSLMIIKESTRKDTIVAHGPNVITSPTGGAIVIPPVNPGPGAAGGVMQFGDMPIRRNKLDKYMNVCDQQMKALESYVQALIIPETQGEAVTLLSTIRETMKEAQERFDRLKELSAEKRLANSKIARQALAVHDLMMKLKSQRNQLSSMVLADARNDE